MAKDKKVVEIEAQVSGLGKINKQIDEFSQKMEELGKRISDYFEKGGKSLKISETWGKLNKELNSFRDNTKIGERELSAFGERFNHLSTAVTTSAKELSQWGKFTKSLASNIRTFFGYRIINTVVRSTKELSAAAVELESSFANIQAITRASDAEMGKLRTTILRVGEASKYSVEEIAKATTTLGQAGLSAEEINNVLETTTQLAAGTGSELSNTVDLMTSALAVWGLNSEEASHLSDVMVTGMNRTKATLETFRMAVQYAGATMSSLNISFDEFASVAAAASNAGLRASVVGTGLRAMTSELISPTTKMVKGLQSLGLTTEDVNIESQGLVNVLYKLKNAGLSAANAYDMFGRRAAQFVLAAQGQLDVVDELQVAFKESGATLEAYNTQMNTISAQWTALGNTMKEMAANVLDSISGLVVGTLKAINKAFQGVMWLFSDKDKLKFEEMQKQLQDEKIAGKSFYDVVDQLSKRDYGKNAKQGIDDLNEVIDKMNEKFGTTISYVDQVENLADAFERVKDEIRGIDSEKVNRINEEKLREANRLIEESKFGYGAIKPYLPSDKNEKRQVISKYLSRGDKFSDEAKSYIREYKDRLFAGEKINVIQREVKSISDEYDKALHQMALDKAKEVFEQVGAKVELTSTSREYDTAIQKIGDEFTSFNEEYKSYIEDVKTTSEELKKTNDVLSKSKLGRLDRQTTIMAFEEQIRKSEELQKLTEQQLLDRAKAEGIVNDEEQRKYVEELKKTADSMTNLMIQWLNNILKTTEDELALGINKETNTAIKSRVSDLVQRATTVKSGDSALVDAMRSAAIKAAELEEKNRKKDARTAREIERDRARRFNLKYQNLAIQQQADAYAQDIEQARRKGILSAYGELDKTGTIGGAYSRLSAEKERRERFKTAYGKQATFDRFKADYGDLWSQFESGKISLEDADFRSDKVISKMVELKKSIEEAKGEFGELNETNLDKINAELADIDEQMKKLGKDSETVFGQMKLGFQETIKKMNEEYSLANLGSTIAKDLADGMSTALISIVEHTKSAKEAFSDMAKSILEDISRMLIRMAVMRAMLAAFGGGGSQVYDSAIGPTQTANTAGFFGLKKGGFIPKIRAALGTAVRGGTPGRDSVPAMLMPGEYVLKKSAVDALGTNFLNDLNNNAAQTLASTAANLMQTSDENGSGESSVVNVWVVSKEEEAKMGPNDVIATISKDIMTGGQTRRLIQSVVVGRK